ncbi:hypothetical protein ABZV91_21145 [Nocardia sp. NPDC004568]|uniref:hypothetical protein n=1 Tax=Nocardia sp. NPDC004568 TaxID=3154551 RepID=UPI0033BC73AF
MNRRTPSPHERARASTTERLHQQPPIDMPEVYRAVGGPTRIRQRPAPGKADAPSVTVIPVAAGPHPADELLIPVA